MLNFSIIILGCGSALPTALRMPTSQIVLYNTTPYLIDCGEGTQVQLRKNNISLLKINNIFISHLHGDHFYGIFGLLSTFGMLGRKKPLNIYAPENLKKYCELLLISNNNLLQYDINFIPLKKIQNNLILSDKYLDVYSFPLKHSVAVWGFKFVEKNKTLNIKKELIEELNLSIADIVKIKNGENFVLDNGLIIPNNKLTIKPEKARSYAFCTDTLPLKNLENNIRNVDLLYHEATYANDNKILAKKTFHSTANQAAEIAKLCDVKKLLIGHYSSRYTETDTLLNEAKSIFTNTIAVYDNLVVEI
jgi:ribonuclease Z